MQILSLQSLLKQYFTMQYNCYGKEMESNTAELNGNTPSSLLQTGLHSTGLCGTVLPQGNCSTKGLLKALLTQL